MNHELVMSTSMPAIDPIRSVPGGRGDGGVRLSPGAGSVGSDTSRA